MCKAKCDGDSDNCCDRYVIVRFYRDSNRRPRIVAGGRVHTRAEAQAHCSREDTHELDRNGVPIWFDGFDRECRRR